MLASSALSADDDENSDALSHWRAHRMSLLWRQIPIYGVVAACGSRLRQAVRAAGGVCVRRCWRQERPEAFALPGQRARRHEIGRAACVSLPGEDRSVHAKGA